MLIIRHAEEMQTWSQQQRLAGQRLGLVPTMGFLHQGHLSLVQKAKTDCERVIVSIFVNPLQFAPNEDLADYPRDFDRDTALLETEGVDVVFAPSSDTMYPPDFSTAVLVGGELTQKLCGRSRPTHFQGVTTVVGKLFHLCLPDRVYFGQKDAQQATIIEKMVAELNFPLEVIRGPIVREPDGLALSSRNNYLNTEQRQQALVLYRSLSAAKAAIAAGEREVESIRTLMLKIIEQSPQAVVDYIEICDAKDLREIQCIDRPALIALAVKLGKTRLIDNMVVEG